MVINVIHLVLLRQVVKKEPRIFFCRLSLNRKKCEQFLDFFIGIIFILKEKKLFEAEFWCKESNPAKSHSIFWRILRARIAWETYTNMEDQISSINMHRFDFFGVFMGEANVTSHIIKECTLTKSKHDPLTSKCSDQSVNRYGFVQKTWLWRVIAINNQH